MFSVKGSKSFNSQVKADTFPSDTKAKTLAVNTFLPVWNCIPVELSVIAPVTQEPLLEMEKIALLKSDHCFNVIKPSLPSHGHTNGSA